MRTGCIYNVHIDQGLVVQCKHIVLLFRSNPSGVYVSEKKKVEHANNNKKKNNYAQKEYIIIIVIII